MMNDDDDDDGSGGGGVNDFSHRYNDRKFEPVEPTICDPGSMMGEVNLYKGFKTNMDETKNTVFCLALY
uniref:Uncharacterized protein n=1 Tax=Octopus bimaculoides TaxID=37653 RepID=A0A0L8HHQ0_OCTBM